MTTYMGFVAVFFTIYNIMAGYINRFVSGNNAAPLAYNIEAAIWFLAATVCFK